MSTAESNVESDARLATNQELIWLGQRLQADVPLFEVPYLYTIRGTIEPDVLSAAFKDLIHANETLRTVSADRQWSRARCAQRTNFRCEAIDLSTHVDPEAAAQSFVDAQLGEAFDPTESLCRATLMGVGPDHWKLLVVIHHALTDALCGRALLKNLAAFYEARQAGSANPVAHGYQRFLDRESETLVDADWWAERSNHRVDSRFYRAIAAPGSNRHTRIVHASAELDESIRMLSGTKPFRQITPALGHFNVLATALTSWLYRLSPRGAVSIGATAHGRSTPEFRDTIGLFMQLLPFRVPTDAEDIFESVSRKIATESMGFLQHSMPGRMTAASQRAFDVVLNVIDLSVDDFCGMPTSMEWLHNGYGEPDRKLCLSAHLRGGSWELLFDFNDDAFDPQERQRAIEHFTGTLRSMATQPKALIRDYSLLTSEESRRLSALNATADPTPSASRSGTAWERFREHASDQLDDTAIVCAASQLKYTYEELLERAQATARQIACADVGPLVPLVCRRNAHAVVGALGVLASGRCFLPIDADLPRSRIETLLEQAGSTQLVDVTTETFSVRKSGIVSPSVCPLTENACYTLFTSGSTGLPSGVVVGDDSILNLLKEFERLGPLGSRARCGWWTNVGFDVAIYEVFSAILYGRELHIPAESTRTQADAMVEWLNSTLIESIYLPPYFLSRLGQRIREYGATSLRRLLVGVEPIPQELLASIAESSPELHLINGYGPTEATVCATLELIDPDEKSTGPASIGFPVRGNRLRIIDENGVDAPPGVPGELWIGGGGLAKGYLGDPAKTRNRFVRHDDHDWYRSGDRVRLGEDDKLTFLGRCDDQLKISGVRIEPAEVAATIRELEDVSECVVLPLEREGHPVGLAAFLETTREINEPSLRSELRERLPRAMVPARMVSVDRFPRTLNGKVDRDHLHSLLEAERDDGSASQDSDARTPIEFSLVAIWKEVLVQKQVTVDDDFFWLGGSSLDAMTMSDRAAELGLRFSIQDVFRHPTIRELAGWLEREPRQTIDAAKQTTPSSLTPRQTTLWYLQKSQPQSCAYHFQLRCSVNVQLDPRRVSRALTELSRRHPTLRSTIRDENGVPKLFVHPDSIVSLRETSSLDNPDNLEEDILEEGRRPFDLTREPAWRVRWINSDATGELVWTFHHIGFDEASIATLLREFGQLYRGESLSDVIALPKPAKESGDVSKTWWESKLVDVSVSVDLPVDRRGRKVSEAGSTHRFSISADVAADLRRVASNARVSLSNLLLAAYGVLLRKYSGATSFTIGVPVSRRGNTQSIGYEIDGLPFVFDRDGTGSFRELAESVHHDFTTMLEHSEVSVESLQREHGSLFNVMFVAQQPFPVITLGEDLRLAPEISDLGAAKFDWTLFVRDGDGAIDCSLEYRTDLFDKSTVERFGRHWESLLRAVADSPDTRVSELEFRGTEDREAAKRLRGDLVSLPQGRNCVSEELKNIASKNPNDIAVFHGSDSWTYAALDEAASGVASALAEVAVGDGTPVAVACDRSTEMVAAIFGVLKAGGAYVPIDPLLPAQRFESLMNQVGASIILSCAANTERMSRSTHQVLEVAKQTRVGSEPAVGQSRESLAYVLHTSGSTGAPKGVEVTRGALIDSTAARSVFYEANPERFLMVSPVWFDSSVAGLFWTLSTGGSLVIPEEGDLGDVARLADLIERRQVTDTLMLPSLYRLLLQHCDKQKLRSLRRVIVAGENCPEDLVRLHARSMISTRLFNEYGPTEASVWATACEMHRDDGVSIGRSVPGVEARLLDRHGCEQPIGAVGEIYLGGTRLAKGYRGDPALTDSRFVTRDGQRLYRTGDLARLRADGSLTYLGRIDQQLKVHGQRVEAAEIESALTSIPIIREAAVALSAAPAKELNLERESDLLDALERLDGPLASRLLSEAESIESSTETYELADSDVRVTVQLVNGDFIRTPRERQKKWLLDQVMRETVADLHSLDEVARRMVPGSDSPHLPRDLATEQLSEQEIMEDWQTPLMRSMVQWVTEAGGDVLEIGFGRGVAATAIQQAGVRSHTVIEMNPHSIEDHFRPWRQSYSQRDIRLVEGRWQDALDRLDEYDGVFFHAFPMNEAEFVEYVATSATFAEHFFPHAAALLRSGGVFTYLSTEIDSLSRRHQRSLLKHFGEVQFKVQRLEIPAETKDAWWADSMVVVRAIK